MSGYSDYIDHINSLSDQNLIKEYTEEKAIRDNGGNKYTSWLEIIVNELAKRKINIEEINI